MAVVNQVGNALTSSTGSGAFVGATSPTITTPTIATSLTFSPTTGGIVGTTTNDSTAAGNVGEFVSSVIVNASSVSVTSTSTRDLTSISLTAGDWDVWANVVFQPANTTSVTTMYCWISSTSASIPDDSLICGLSYGASPIISVAGDSGITVVPARFSLSGTTTVYVSLLGVFTVSTMRACGGIYARRVR